MSSSDKMEVMQMFGSFTPEMRMAFAAGRVCGELERKAKGGSAHDEVGTQEAGSAAAGQEAQSGSADE